MIPFDLLITLPEQHVTVLIDICKRHNGQNNGAIGYGWRDANKAARVSRGGRILDDLQKRSIIELTRDASFNMKTGRRTREWKIPFLDPDNPAFKGKRKLHLDYWLLNSNAFGRLKAGEKKLLIELMRRYDGGNPRANYGRLLCRNLGETVSQVLFVIHRDRSNRYDVRSDSSRRIESSAQSGFQNSELNLSFAKSEQSYCGHMFKERRQGFQLALLDQRFSSCFHLRR